MNSNSTIALVPTMGALHKGHLSLIEIAKKHASKVVLSVFVNPLQFNSKDDLNKYPRNLEQDIKMAKEAGADEVFAPSLDQLLPSGDSTIRISAGLLSKTLEGEFRPGHFDGVATIVSILFDKIKPQFAIFGEKDYQQLLVVKELVVTKKYPITIIPAPIIREADGLAMSSRNMRLNPEQRELAKAMPNAINAAKKLVESGERSSDKIIEAASLALNKLKIDYVAVVDSETLTPLKKISVAARLLIAASIDDIRLIDNTAL